MFNFEKKINDLIENNIFEYKDGVMVEDYNRLDCMYIALDELTELFHKTDGRFTDGRFTKDTIMHAILILITKISKLKAEIRKENEQLNEYTHSELISMMDDIFSKQRWEQHDTTVDNTNKKDDLENNSDNKKDEKPDEVKHDNNKENISDKVIDSTDNHCYHCLNCSCNKMVVDRSSLNPFNKSDSDNKESVNTNTDDYTTTIVLDLKCNKNAYEISHLLKKYIESNLIDLIKNDNKKQEN